MIILLKRQDESGQSSTDYDSLAVAAQLPPFAGAVQNSSSLSRGCPLLLQCSTPANMHLWRLYSELQGPDIICVGSCVFLSGPVC